MKEPSSYEKVHWMLFNRFVRIVGAAMALISGAFVYIITKSLITDGVGGPYPPESLFALIPVTVICAIMIKVKPYYPAEYREWFEANKRLEITQTEKWTAFNSFLSYIFVVGIFFLIADIGDAIYKNAFLVKRFAIYLIILFGVWGLKQFVRTKV